MLRKLFMADLLPDSFAANATTTENVLYGSDQDKTVLSSSDNNFDKAGNFRLYLFFHYTSSLQSDNQNFIIKNSTKIYHTIKKNSIFDSLLLHQMSKS